jgi:hypothetical protein
MSSSANTKSRRAVLAEQREKIALIGIPAAVDAAIDICNDKRAPAPARANAAASLFRVAGFFDRGGANEDQDKAPADMTPEELAQAIARLQEDLRRPSVDRDASDADEEDDVFG